MNEKGFVSEKRFVSKKNLSRAWRRLFGKVLNSKEEIEANTSENMIAGAEAVKEVYSSLKNENNESFNFGVKDGVRGFYTDPARADDSFVPFKSDSGITYTKFNDRNTTITIKIQKNGDGIISTCTGASCRNISINGEAIQADNLESFQADSRYSGLASIIFVLHNLKKGDVLTFYNSNQYGGFFIM